MKRIVITVMLLGIFTLPACKKSRDGKSEYPIVYLHDCISKTYTHNEVTLCFDEVIADARCPQGMVCVWEGAAIAKFTFTKNNNDHVLTLSTNPLNLAVSKDTVVDGYKVEFVDLKPYPVGGQNPPPAPAIKAEVKITRL